MDRQKNKELSGLAIISLSLSPSLSVSLASSFGFHILLWNFSKARFL